MEKTLNKPQTEPCTIHGVVGSTVTVVTKRELLDNEFYCSKCQTIHTKSAYAIAQRAMNVDLIFTCTCGNMIDL